MYKLFLNVDCKHIFSRHVDKHIMTLTYSTIDGKYGEKLDRMFDVKNSFIRVEPGRCVLPPHYALFGPKIRDMEIREDDVWMVSYPRTGQILYFQSFGYLLLSYCLFFIFVFSSQEVIGLKKWFGASETISITNERKRYLFCEVRLSSKYFYNM